MDGHKASYFSNAICVVPCDFQGGNLGFVLENLGFGVIHRLLVDMEGACVFMFKPLYRKQTTRDLDFHKWLYVNTASHGIQGLVRLTYLYCL